MQSNSPDHKGKHAKRHTWAAWFNNNISVGLVTPLWEAPNTGACPQPLAASCTRSAGGRGGGGALNHSNIRSFPLLHTSAAEMLMMSYRFVAQTG